MRRFFRRGDEQGERGQSIVLIAFMMIGLLAFVGIAVDVGFVFARSSQLQAAVDAAALAAVTELAINKDAADLKAGQFLNANGIPISQTNVLMNSSAGMTTFQEQQYSVTVTWPIDLFFLRLIGQEDIDLTRGATAAYFPLADIYASRRVEEGALSTSTQGVFGPESCIDHGDPFSARRSPYAPGLYTYNYRILVPGDYPEERGVRVELFDPDSINNANNNVAITHSETAITLGMPSHPVAKSCTDAQHVDNPGTAGNQINPCVVRTGELNLLATDPNLQLDHVNPYWFVRIDENRGAGGGHGNGQCGTPTSYQVGYNTETLYELFYYRQNPDGTVVRVDLAYYTGQTGDYRDTQPGKNSNAPGDHQTDMRWVSPGGRQSYDQPVFVPVDVGSPKTFEILDFNQDLPGILVEPGTGNRFLYLNVTSVSGSSENGYEIWAGPADYIDAVASDVNTRNVQVVNNPAVHYSAGATVFALGRLPMNSTFNNVVDIPLIYVGPEMAGESIFVRHFDSDSGAAPPMIFYFDSLAFQPDDSAPAGYWEKPDPRNATDWAMAFAVANRTDPDGVAFGVRCPPGNCNRQWVDPSYRIIVPGKLENCNRAVDPDSPNCIPFYGGRLIARYKAGFSDTFGWEIVVTGLPYLVR